MMTLLSTTGTGSHACAIFLFSLSSLIFFFLMPVSYVEPAPIHDNIMEIVTNTVDELFEMLGKGEVVS